MGETKKFHEVHPGVVLKEELQARGLSAAAFALAAAGGGACKTVKTTPLLSAEEGIEAMKKAATSGYKPAR